MISPVVVNVRAVFPYFLFIFILYLTGFYFGGWFLFIFYLLLFFLILNVIHIILTALFLKYSQEFSTTHPVKGEGVDYSWYFIMESFVPGCRITLSLIGTLGIGETESEKVEFFPGSRKIFTRKYTIRCPFRGIYTLGIEKLVVSDTFGWMEVRLPVWHKTFYVYPRVIPLEEHSSGVYGDAKRPAGSAEGNAQDFSLYRNLREYQRGDNVHHIAWKKFAALGEPFVRVYENTSWPGITLYLDTRRTGPADYSILEAEDTSVEILVALVRYFMNAGIPLYIRSGEWRPNPIDEENIQSFKDFFDSTMNLYFRQSGPGSVDPYSLFIMDVEDRNLRTGTIIVISHIFDNGVTQLFSESFRKRTIISGIINCTGMNQKERTGALDFAARINEHRERLFTVAGPMTIKEDLEKLL